MSFCMTTCPYCSCGCGILLRAEGGRLQGSYPLSAHPISNGSLCIRGWNCTQAPYHPERLNRALVRRKGILVPVSPQDAVVEIADRLKDRVSLHHQGAAAPILFAVGPTLTNEDVLAVSRLAELFRARACGTELSTVSVARRAMRMVSSAKTPTVLNWFTFGGSVPDTLRS
jgi:anaerobic selenocysteine-containing dehydrogenase